MPRGPKPKDERERFWSHVDRNGPEARPGLGPCWLWTGYRHPLGGHGQFGVKRGEAWITVWTHVYSYALACGEPKLFVLHHCDVAACVNPEHLYEGTQAENVRDAVQRGRLKPPPRMYGEQHPQARLSNEQVEALRALRGVSQRELARSFGVSRSQIGRILRKESRA